ncbi:hypothetical protein Pan161_46960 [Gimesia algae]|uniref:Glycosyltransferase RgtA/B/C/D-like domain-containing protein n=2 Tax=Gimesia algae TaxID=2527971 RepID=A0A517VJ43_9PLAN|nr:hypothetical protein Pan161_46960 [Gimesia algae]
MIALVLALLAGAVWPVIATLWFVFASILVGHRILAFLKITEQDSSFLMKFLTGAGLYASLVSLSAHVPINYPVFYGIGLLLPVLFDQKLARDYLIQFKNWILGNNEDPYRFNLLDCLLTTLALIYFVVALMPEVGHDALAMHLFIPVHMAAQHQWGFDASIYVWAVMPLLGDWIYSICYMLGGETAVRLINVCFILLLTGLIKEFVLWLDGDETTVRWTNLIFLSTPLTFAVGSSLFIESIWTAYIIAGAIIVFRFWEDPEPLKSRILLAGLLLGFALATKAVTLLIIPGIFLILLYRWKYWCQLTWITTVGSGLFLFALPGSIPYLTALVKTGNPVFPFFNQIFKSEYFAIKNFDNASIFGKGLHWDFLYRVVFHTGEFLESYVGGSGFQWLLLFIPALGALVITKNKKALALFMVAALSLYLSFRSVSYIRYTFPEWLMLTTMAGCLIFSPMMRKTRLHNYFISAGCMTVVLNVVFLNSAAFYGDFQIKSLLSHTHRQTYLSERSPVRSAVKLVNEINMSRSPVAIFAAPYVAGLTSDALHCSWYNSRFQGLITNAQTEESIITALKNEGVDYMILDSSWKDPQVIKQIQKVTDVIAEIDEISVRRLSEKYQFTHELLQSSEFNKIEGWTLHENADFDDAERLVSVDVQSPVYQVIPVKPNKRYQNMITARSDAHHGQARMQINWLDTQGRFIDTDLRPIQCSESWNSYSMRVNSPPNAYSAIVYCTGHSNKKIQFKKNSFKE